MITTTKRATSYLLALFMLSATVPAFSAAIVDPLSAPVWGIGGFTLKESNLKLGATKAYRSWFENGAWLGDLVEYDVATDGSRTTDVTLGNNPATDGTSNWSARYEFDRKENPTAADPPVYTTYWKTGRKIITWDGTNQVGFRFDTISAAQRTVLDPDTDTAGAYDSDILNFVRGDRSQESPDGVLRARYGLLGDPGKNQPLYIGAPTVSPLLAGHAQYKADNLSRPGRVIMSANDGMVHVFDAATGIEEYAYVPSILFPTLKNLTTLISTSHKSFVDGQLTSADAKISGNWKTLVAGGLGGGAKGLFALDLTSATLSSETSTASADQKVLWERTDSALGYIHGAPTIAPIGGATWYVVTGNGYLSTDDVAKLYMAPVDGGAAVTIATDLMTGNGLSAPALLDVNGNGTVDIAFAGDLLGRMWKFDLNNPNTAATLLFDAGSSKPITTKPDVALHPNGGFLVYFGTGSLLSIIDAQDVDNVQTVYAIWDYPGRTTAVTDGTFLKDIDGDGMDDTVNILLTQSLSEAEYSFTDTVPEPDEIITRKVRLASDNTPDWSYNKGWKLDLASGTGERVINDVTVRASRLQFVTDSPRPSGDTEHPTGESWLLELHWLSGGDINKVFFDLNGDGDLNDEDKITQDLTEIVPIGISLGLGNRSKPTFGRVANGVDTIFINGVDLATFQCSGSCAGGLEGGHFDVDTDLELGGGTDTHKHEYDDSYNATFVDYFDIFSGNSMDDVVASVVGFDATTEFIVVLANADFSNQGILTLGTKDYNVVDYQELIYDRLINYDGDITNAPTHFVDEGGRTLILTLQDIIDAEGTMATTFNYNAIITGGLHPTTTGCMKGHNKIEEFGRWRNGAYTFQMIRLDSIGAYDSATCPAALYHDPATSTCTNSWVEQAPVDTPEGLASGGMYGNPANDAGFIYESTIFWHWSDNVAGEVLDTGGGQCYGEDGWYDAKRVETGGITMEEFSALFPNYELQQDYIDSLANQLITFTCEDGVGEACEKDDAYKALLEDLEDLVGNAEDFLWLRQFLEGSNSGGASEVNSDGTVAEVGGSGDTEEDTEFSGTPTGRISWIDLRS